MLSNGEIYHMAFEIWQEYIKKGMQVSVAELRGYLRELNKQDMSKQEMEEKARGWVEEKISRR